MGTPTVSGVPSTGYVSQYFSDYPPVFSEALSKIEAIPGVVNMLQKVKAEGDITIGVDADIVEAAAWDRDNRKIIFKPADVAQDTLSLADKIDYLIFEICNASRTTVFANLGEQIKNRSLNIEQYVEKVEMMEFLTARQNKQLIDEGCKAGILEKDMFKNINRTSDDPKINYAYQQLNGHSLQIAERFQAMFPGENHPYVGTVGHLSEKNKKFLNSLIIFDNVDAKDASDENKLKICKCLMVIKQSKNAEDRALCQTIHSLFMSKKTFIGQKWTLLHSTAK